LHFVFIILYFIKKKQGYKEDAYRQLQNKENTKSQQSNKNNTKERHTSSIQKDSILKNLINSGASNLERLGN